MSGKYGSAEALEKWHKQRPKTNAQRIYIPKPDPRKQTLTPEQIHARLVWNYAKSCGIVLPEPLPGGAAKPKGKRGPARKLTDAERKANAKASYSRHYEAHKAEILAKQRALWAQKHPDSKPRPKLTDEERRERNRAKCARYRAAHRDEVNAKARERRAKKKSAQSGGNRD